MKSPAAGFGVNTYSYIFDGSAADTVTRLADHGYGGVELMFFPGHLWPAELDGSQLRRLRDLCETRLRLVAVNMPNVDMNIAAAAAEMRAYTLDLLTKFVRCAGELGAGGIIVGPGKANPLFPMPRDRMVSHFYRALDVLAPLARQAGTKLLIENMPFAFLPDAESLMNIIDGYGDDSIRVIYDVANAHFIGEAPAQGLRRVRDRLSLVHFSDTTRQSYKHDPLGHGDVPLAGLASVMREIGYAGLPMLEVISLQPDSDIADSCRLLREAGFGGEAPRPSQQTS
jgi:sugar phosphate isomerase/epimerase